MCDVISEKQIALKPYLVDGQLYHRNSSLFNVLDAEKFANITKVKLKTLLFKPCFSEEERSCIKELRRKYQCRRTSKKHREIEKVAELATEIEIECLKLEKLKLEEEQKVLIGQITELKVLLLSDRYM